MESCNLPIPQDPPKLSQKVSGEEVGSGTLQSGLIDNSDEQQFLAENQVCTPNYDAVFINEDTPEIPPIISSGTQRYCVELELDKKQVSFSNLCKERANPKASYGLAHK